MTTTHRTFIFFVPERGPATPISQDDYAQLVRGELQLRHLAGQRVRVADWYAEMADGRPAKVIDETYSALRLDEQGRVSEIEAEGSSLPGTSERSLLEQLLFTSGSDDAHDAARRSGGAVQAWR